MPDYTNFPDRNQQKNTRSLIKYQTTILNSSFLLGVLDSGINSHEDFGVRLLSGCNYIEGADDSSDTSDTLGHGTAVAGLIAGAGDNGYIGTAPAAELIPLKVTNGQDVKISAICRAIYGGIDDFDCNVLDLSLGANGSIEGKIVF